MIQKVIGITSAYFLLGAVLLYMIIRRQNNRQKTRQALIKYFVYLVIVSGMLLLAYSGKLKYAGAAISVLAIYEVFQLMIRPGKTLNRQFIAAFPLLLFMVYCLLWYCDRLNNVLQLYTYTLVFTFDGFSQLTGQLAGKHLLAPRISPGKTWEGFAGGIAASLLTAFLLADSLPFHIVLFLWSGTALCAFYGDLYASYCKRLLGIKDYSNLVPGHGGILDRFDSLAGASVFMYLASYFFSISM